MSEEGRGEPMYECLRVFPKLVKDTHTSVHTCMHTYAHTHTHINTRTQEEEEEEAIQAEFS